MGQHVELRATRCKTKKNRLFGDEGVGLKIHRTSAPPLPGTTTFVKRERIVGLGYGTLERA
jgi:hypothetical protein